MNDRRKDEKEVISPGSSVDPAEGLSVQPCRSGRRDAQDARDLFPVGFTVVQKRAVLVVFKYIYL